MSLKNHVLKLIEESPLVLASALASAGLYAPQLAEPESNTHKGRKQKKTKYQPTKRQSDELPPGPQVSYDSSSAGSKAGSRLVIPIGFLRLKQIIGNPKANPPIPPIIPVCRSTWWAGIRAGIYPPGIKLSPRITVWPSRKILELLESNWGDEQ